MTVSSISRAVKPFGLFVGLSLIFACGSPSDCDGTRNLRTESLAFDPSQITVAQGQVAQTTLRATNFAFDTRQIKLEIFGHETRIIRPVQSVTNNMLVRFDTGGAAPLALGTYTITAKSGSDPEKTATWNVQVVAPQGNKFFTDNTFVQADWTVHEDFLSGGATHSESQMNTGGDPGAYRHMLHTMPSDSQIRTAHIYKEGLAAGRFNPPTDGAVSKIDFSESRIQVNRPFFSAAIGSQAAIWQNGKIYSAAFDTFTSLGWTQREAKGLVAANFSAKDGTHPDFSAAGAPMWFGYQRTNGNQPGGVGIVYSHGIDNWAVTVYRQ